MGCYCAGYYYYYYYYYYYKSICLEWRCRMKLLQYHCTKTIINLVRLFWDIEQVSLQLARENAKRRFRSDTRRQCIPGSGGRHRESPVSKCGTSRQRYQQDDGVIRPRPIRRLWVPKTRHLQKLGVLQYAASACVKV